MSIEKIQLRTLLKYFGLSPDRRLAAVRADARSEIRKRRGGGGSGGDFHSCFWADAKAHTVGTLELLGAVDGRIVDNPNRARLYPLLAEGFLEWWREKRRWINEEISQIPESIKAPYHFVEIDGIVRVENLLALRVGQD